MTAALTFTSTARDPVTGTPRTVTLTIAGAALFVGIAPANGSRHVDPHSATADFTPQLESISTAIQRAAEERSEIDRPYVCPEPMCGATESKPHARGCVEGEIEARAMWGEPPGDDNPWNDDVSEGDDDE